jgi:LysM repeat protein
MRHDRFSRPVIALGFILGLLASGGSRVTHAASAQASERAYELIAEVNALRASYGLAPYEVDPILMAVAEAQNAWRVSTGATTHLGPDGSRPRDRAIAAGYGGGATVFISENIADGTELTPAEAVTWWTGDDPHLNTMIGPNYRHVGAGAGESGGVWRYTLMAGYVAGGSYEPGSVPVGPVGGQGSSGAVPFLLSTPSPDGSVVHIVEQGQTLWTIAAMYEVDLALLREINGLPADPILHIGDEILVRLANTPTPLPTAIPTPTPTSRAATRTPAPTRTPAIVPTSTAVPPLSSPPLGQLRWPFIAAGALLVAVGLAAGLAQARSHPRDEKTRG